MTLQKDHIEMMRTILNAAAAGKPLEYKRKNWTCGFLKFNACAEEDVGFNFRDYEYRLAKEKRSVTFRVALICTNGAVRPSAVTPSFYGTETSPDFVKWVGEEQTAEYEVEP